MLPFVIQLNSLPPGNAIMGLDGGRWVGGWIGWGMVRGGGEVGVGVCGGGVGCGCGVCGVGVGVGVWVCGAMVQIVIVVCYTFSIITLPESITSHYLRNYHELIQRNSL